MKNMKVILFSLIICGLVSACAKTKSDSPSGGAKKAVNADGSCTSEVVADYSLLRSQTLNFAQTASNKLSQDPDSVSGKEMEDASKTYLAQVKAFRQSYGNFTCLAQSNGRVVTVDPSAIYAKLDEVDKVIQQSEAQAKGSAIGKDGQCTPQFSQDYKETSKQMLANLKPFFSFLKEALQAARSGAPVPKEELGQAANAGEQTLRVAKEFRQRHPGNFACTTVNEMGINQIVSSEQLDKGISQIKQGLDQIESQMPSLEKP